MQSQAAVANPGSSELKIVTVSNGTDNRHKEGDDSPVVTGHCLSVDTDYKVTGEMTSSGSFYSINIPGYGKVFRKSGRYRASTDRFVGVRTLNPETAELICETLAGD